MLLKSICRDLERRDYRLHPHENSRSRPTCDSCVEQRVPPAHAARGGR